jgi:putative nucleotidyltransferase with HDIG domain
LARERGARVWLVGGAVRDLLLERPVHDWDFCVDRDALGLARAAADELGGAYFPLDAERGAGRVILSAAEQPWQALDFAALRGSDLEADLGVRDFTVDALALDDAGALIDPTGGQADLAARRVRATGESAFQDDPVRLLRAVRMEAELGFQIEPRTAEWIRRDASLLARPSAERVRDEFVRLLALPGAAAHLYRLDELGLLSPVFPELASLKGVTQSPPHRFDVWHHTLLVLDVLEGVIAAVTGASHSWTKAPASVQTAPAPAQTAPAPVPGASYAEPASLRAPSERDPGTAHRGVSADIPPAAWGDLARTLGQFATDVRAHLAVELSSGRDRTLLLKLAALLHDVGKPQTCSQDEDGRIHFHNHEPVGARIAADRLQALRFSRDEIDRAWVIIGQHLRPAHLARAGQVTGRAVYRYFRATGCGGVDVVLLALADHLATWGPNLDEQRWAQRLEVAETLLIHWFERHEETVAPPPLLTGDDLMAELGLEPGPQIGRLLEAVREAQAAGEVHSREEALALARAHLPRG